MPIPDHAARPQASRPIPPSTRLPRCALVTGASSGVGAALALALAERGTDVVALGRDPARLAAVSDRHPRIAAIAADLADVDALGELGRRLARVYPALDCVIHNAGVQYPGRFDAPDYGAREIRHEIDVNLVAPLALTRALWPHLVAQPRAALVHVTSGLAYAPKRGAAVYSATKAGLRLAGRALRVQAAGTGVRCVEVVLPLVDTPMTTGRGRGKLSPEAAARAIVAGLAAGADAIHVGKARWLPWIDRFAPRLLERVLQSSD